MDHLFDDDTKQSIIFLILGIMLGVFFQIVGTSLFGGGAKTKSKTESQETSEEDWEDESGSEDEDASNANAEMSPEKDKALEAQYPIDDIKMMLAVRSDLGMTKGKIGAQCGHATLGAYHTTKKWAQSSQYWRKVLQTWQYVGQKKVCVKATSEAHL